MKNAPFRHLYVHVPFCEAKCDYCAFHSVPNADPEQHERYLRTLASDLDEATRKATLLKTVYVGGGTPTVLGVKYLKALGDVIATHFQLSEEVEISIECNPESLTPEKADVLAAVVNRVSIGVQTFNPGLRKILGRRGQGERARDAVRLLRERDLDNLGADLIYAIPGQTEDMWRDDLRRAVDLGVHHLSTYALTIDEGANLAGRREFPGVGDDVAAEMWYVADEILGGEGFHRYEISNFARPGSECVHNREIWLGDAYAGVGPTATSFDGEVRWTRAELDQWLDGARPVSDEISPEQRRREVFIMGLRLAAGWRRETFRSRVGGDWNDWRSELEPLIDMGLLTEGEDVVHPTPKGMRFWDEVAESLLL